MHRQQSAGILTHIINVSDCSWRLLDCVSASACLSPAIMKCTCRLIQFMGRTCCVCACSCLHFVLMCMLIGFRGESTVSASCGGLLVRVSVLLTCSVLDLTSAFMCVGLTCILSDAHSGRLDMFIRFMMMCMLLGRGCWYYITFTLLYQLLSLLIVVLPRMGKTQRNMSAGDV